MNNQKFPGPIFFNEVSVAGNSALVSPQGEIYLHFFIYNAVKLSPYQAAIGAQSSITTTDAGSV